MADEYGLVCRVDGGLRHALHQRQQRRPAAPGLADGNEAAFIIYVHHRLNGEHGAEQRRGGADTAAALEVVEIVHRTPVADVEAGLLRKGLYLVQTAALLLFHGAEVYQKSLPQGGAEGVHRFNARIGKFASQLLRCNDGGLVGGGEGGGKAEAENVPPGLQEGPHFILKFAHVHGGGGGQLPSAEPGVKLLKADVPSVRVVAVAFSAHFKAQGQNLYAQLRGHFRGEVAAAIGEQHVITHGPSAPFRPWRLCRLWGPVSGAAPHNAGSQARRHSSEGRSARRRPPGRHRTHRAPSPARRR